MLKNLHAQRMQEQVLPTDRLIEIEACIAVFGNYGLFRTLKLLQLLHLVEVFRVDESVMLVFRVDTTLFKEMAS